MSIATVAPAVAHAATAFPTPAPGADPIARFHQQVRAELKLTALEHAVQDLAQRLFAPTKPPRSIRRRSRRSAWLPSN